jgi:hypothetical protein
MKVNGSYIYYLIYNSEVVYVGQSKGIIQRLYTHKSIQKKKFDSVELFEFNEDCDLDVEEFKAIVKHQPTLNKMLPPLGFIIPKSRVLQINACLNDSGITFEKYKLEQPDLSIELNLTVYNFWIKRGCEQEFANRLESMCNGLESKL